MCRLINALVVHIVGLAVLNALFLVSTYVPTILYAKYADYHCVASVEDGVAEYVRALQGRCPSTKNVWVLEKSDPSVVMFWCEHYHIVSHTHIMSKVQIMNRVSNMYGTRFVWYGAFHLIEASCSDMYNPTIENVCTYPNHNEVSYNEPYCLYGKLSEQTMNSSYIDYLQCVAGNYRELMMKFVHAKMVRYNSEPTVLNRITLHWPVTGTDADCKILDEIFV